MFVFIVINFLVIPLAFLSTPAGAPSCTGWSPPASTAGGTPPRCSWSSPSWAPRSPVAAVLPAVEHRRQADHAPVDQLRAGRHRTGSFITVAAAALLMAVVAAAFAGRATSATSPTPAAWPRACSTWSAGPPGRSSPSSCSTPRSSGRGGDPVHQLRLRRRLRGPPLAAPWLAGRQVLLRCLHGDGGAGAGIVIIPGAPLG